MTTELSNKALDEEIRWSSAVNKDIFRPRRQRWCTDVACLVLFALCMGSVFFIGYACVSEKPELLYSFVYPADSYGNNCGRPGTAVADWPKVFYPDLDADIVTHGALLAAQQYGTFFARITKLCAAECPDGVSLSQPTVYGGASYPTAEAGSGDFAAAAVPEYYYTFRSQEVAGRCFPLTSSYLAGTQELCVTPSCTDGALNASLAGDLACVDIASRPDEATTWDVCPAGASAAACEARRALCEYAVTRTASDSFLPRDYAADSTAVTEEVALYVESFVGAVDAVATAWAEVALFGAVAPLALGFGWCVLLWWFAATVIYSALALAVASMLGLSAYLAAKAGWFASYTASAGGRLIDEASSAGFGWVAELNGTLYGDADTDTAVRYGMLSVVCLGLGLVLLVLVCLWHRNIRRCIAIVKEVTQVFRTLPALMAWPLLGIVTQLSLLGIGVVCLWWVLDDEVWSHVSESHGVDVGVSEQLYIALYVVFAFLWAVNLVKAVQWTSIASAVCYWFVHDARTSRKCCAAGTGVVRLLDATWTVVSKHLGSMAVGAGFIALCQLARLLLHAVDRSTKGAQDASLVLRLAMKCAHCCLWCLEKSVKFVSYYAYCFVALDGASFCRAAKSTFALLSKYPRQLAVNKIVAFLLRVLLLVTTPCLCAISCYAYLSADDAFAASFSPFYPAAVAFLAALLVADGFTTVFVCSVDTVYLCAFRDMDENEPPKFMSSNLRKGFGLDAAIEEFDARAYGGDGEGGGGNRAKVAPAPHVRLGETSKLVSQTPVQPYDGEGE